MTGWLGALGVLVLAGALSTVVGDKAARRGVLLCGGITAAAWTVRRLFDPTSQLISLAGESAGEYLTPLLKGVGIAWAAWLVSLVLRELGASNAASVAELVGAAELAVIAAPFLVRLVSAALSLV